MKANLRVVQPGRHHAGWFDPRRLRVPQTILRLRQTPLPARLLQVVDTGGGPGVASIGRHRGVVVQLHFQRAGERPVDAGAQQTLGVVTHQANAIARHARTRAVVLGVVRHHQPDWQARSAASAVLGLVIDVGNPAALCHRSRHTGAGQTGTDDGAAHRREWRVRHAVTLVTQAPGRRKLHVEAVAWGVGWERGKTGGSQVVAVFAQRIGQLNVGPQAADPGQRFEAPFVPTPRAVGGPDLLGLHVQFAQLLGGVADTQGERYLATVEQQSRKAGPQRIALLRQLPRQCGLCVTVDVDSGIRVNHAGS